MWAPPPCCDRSANFCIMLTANYCIIAMHIYLAIWRGWTERSQISPVASKLSTPPLSDWSSFWPQRWTRVWDNVNSFHPIHSHKDSHRDIEIGTRKKIEICDEAYVLIGSLSCVNESRWTRVWAIWIEFIPTRIHMEIQERKWINCAWHFGWA